MQNNSYNYVSGMVLTNIGITPSSHNLKQLKNAPIPLHTYPDKKSLLSVLLNSFSYLSHASLFCYVLRQYFLTSVISCRNEGGFSTKDYNT